jgi:lactoylglutathione lyase
LPHIHHVALWVEDLEAVCAFYVQAFGAVAGPLYQNRSHGFASRFLSLESGARIEVMKTTHLHPVTHAAGAQRMGLTHLAISLGSENAVDELTKRLRAMGCPVLDEAHHTGDGYYESVVLDPEGNRIELTV